MGAGSCIAPWELTVQGLFTRSDKQLHARLKLALSRSAAGPSWIALGAWGQWLGAQDKVLASPICNAQWRPFAPAQRAVGKLWAGVCLWGLRAWLGQSLSPPLPVLHSGSGRAHCTARCLWLAVHPPLQHWEAQPFMVWCWRLGPGVHGNQMQSASHLQSSPLPFPF